MSTEPLKQHGGLTRLERGWPWMLLVLMFAPALWHVVDFPDDVDPEFPRVVRPTFSHKPPPAYRLAEPGDTLDRVGIYVSAAGAALSVAMLVLCRSRGPLLPLGLSLIGLWHSATPGPTFDGWHGLGWRVVLDANAPTSVRIWVSAVGVGLLGLAGTGLAALRGRMRELWNEGKRLGAGPVFVAAAGLVAARQVEIPWLEPAGYWPRWCFDAGVALFDCGLIQILAQQPVPARGRLWGLRLTGPVVWLGLVVAGIWMSWYHRPLDRLHAVVPGRIYISAMPTYRGLSVAHARHGFKTIINVFAEDTPLRSPILPDELRFVKEHGIRYLNAPPEQSKSDEFLDETLRLSQDPSAWPILLHCHGCMDRSPAWMGIYRFLIEKKPLTEILQEIEHHRGYRPKASVVLLYNRVLLARDRERYLSDPVGKAFLEGAKGTIDPYYELVRREQMKAASRTR